MGTPPPSLTENGRKLIRFPAFDLLVIAFPGPSLRLVRSPVEPMSQEATDIVGVVGDAEMLLNEPGDTGRGPEFIGVAVCSGALTQELFQVDELSIRQASFCPRRWTSSLANRTSRLPSSSIR